MKWLALLLIFSLKLSAQAELKLLNTTKVPPRTDFFTVDQFGNYYLVLDEQIIKLNPKGELLYSYSDPLYGAITNVDALSAMNPLLFYNDVNQIRILDNRLNETQQINLLDAGFIDPFLVAYSDENNIWIYDQVKDQLVRYNLSFRKTNRQSLIITQISGNENRPRALYSSFDRVLLQVPEKGLMIFDAQGSYMKSIPSGENQMIAFDNEMLLQLSDKGALHVTNIKTGKENIHLLPEKEVRALYLEGDKLYLLLKAEIKTYQIKPTAR